MMKTELIRKLRNCICSSCNGCDYYDYSTRAISHVCNNKESPYYGFMETDDGCNKHSELITLDKELGDVS